MVLYAGEAVRVRAEVLDPDTGAPLVLREDDPIPTATIKLWGPGKNPARDPTIRNSPDHGPRWMTYRTEHRDFVIFIHTREGSWPSSFLLEDGSLLMTEDGMPLGLDEDVGELGEKWQHGRWSFRVEVTGNVFTNWEYGTFTLRP